MLEKTAASLEPCGLQRVLPAATNSFRSRRQLHTAFWQHGAADVELTNAWQVLMHGVFDSSMDSAAPEPSAATLDPRYPSLRASSFLLDFLYPTGTLAFLRRFSPVAIDRTDVSRTPSTFARISPRMYSSSAPAREPSIDESKDSSHGAQQSVRFGEALDAHNAGTTRVIDQGPRANARPSGKNEIPQERGATQRDPSTMSVAEMNRHTEQLERLLVSSDPEDADKIWYHYTSLDDRSKQDYLGQMLAVLSKTGRVTDSWKISELFQQLDPAHWDDRSFLAGLEAEMNLQNTNRAHEIFVQGLDNTTLKEPFLVDAFDLMLAAALRSQSGSQKLLYALWKQHDKMAARFDVNTITKRLIRVRQVQGLGDVVIGLKPYMAKVRGLKGVSSLKKLLVRCALMACPEKQVLPLLRMTNDPLAYEMYIRNSANLNPRKSLLIQVYKIYRDLPQSVPTHAALHTIFHTYKSMDSRDIKLPGMEMLWADWLKFHQTPSRRAYQFFLGFHASNGDKKRVFSLWKDYIKFYRDANVLQGDDTFVHLIQVHAVRGEAAEAQRIFDEISTKFHLQPNRYCWTNLLQAYVKAGDYEGAVGTFEKLQDALGGLDPISIGTLMHMASGRGDLALTVDLYRRGRRDGRIISTDVSILCSLVEAYCQNDLFREAEDLCTRAAGRGNKDPWMWNLVLRAYAVRRNLADINKLLNLMTELAVPYNQHTYYELLNGLALCRQPEYALHLLSVAINDGAFEVNEDHFHIVMGAFIKTGNADQAVKVHKLMQQCGFGESADSIVALMTAFSQWSLHSHTRTMGHSQQTLIGAALRRFYKAYGLRNVKGEQMNGPHSPSPSPSPVRQTTDLMRRTKTAHHFSRLVYIFMQMKDFVKVQELVDLYRYVAYGDRQSSEPLPIQMLNSIMWANFAEGKYAAVQETWETMFAMAQGGSLATDGAMSGAPQGEVLARYHYILNDGIKVMQSMYIDQMDPVSLQRLFREVRSAGFQIDSRNWNLHVQGLVQCHAYKQAFDVCEEWLMPNWTGWLRARVREPMKNALPLDLRRKGVWPRYLRPVSHTMYYLAKGYIEVDKMAPWSTEAARIMTSIKTDCPRCYRAVTSMTRTGSAMEQEILGEDLSRLGGIGNDMEDLELSDDQVYELDDGNVAGTYSVAPGEEVTGEDDAYTSRRG